MAVLFDMDHTAATYAVADALAQSIASWCCSRRASSSRATSIIAARSASTAGSMRRTPRSCCRPSRFRCAMACSPGATCSPDGFGHRGRRAFVWSTPRIADDAIAGQLQDCRRRGAADRRLHGAAQSALRHPRGRGCRSGALTIQQGNSATELRSTAMIERSLNCFWILLGGRGRRLCVDARSCRAVGTGKRPVSVHRSADRHGRGRGAAVAVVGQLARRNFRAVLRSAGSSASIAGLAFMAVSIPYLGFAVAGFITMIILLRAVENPAGCFRSRWLSPRSSSWSGCSAMCWA